MEALPWYLHLGMPIEMFWHDDPWLAAIYRRKHQLDVEARSEETWLQGLYVSNAINAALGNVYGKKGAKRQKYIAKPLRLTPMTEAERLAEEKRETQEFVRRLTAYENQWRSRHENQ